MRIGEFAHRLDVSPATIKRLERAGFFRAKRDWANQRRFDENDLALVRALLYERTASARRG
jgi:DNA-binding transcriptional MerR regulator